jgi:hypothetical protein
MRLSVIVVAFTIIFANPIFGQGKWIPIVKDIGGYPPTGAAFLNENYGFVSTIKGTFRTTDGGRSWIKTNLAPGINRSQFYFYTPSNIFFAGAYESTDSGMTWRGLRQPSDEQLYIKNGIFFDASGRISYDHANTWKVLDTNFISGEAVIGNLDSSIAMWGGSAYGNDTTLYTTDLGKTWKLGNNGVESDYGYALPYSLTYFRAGGDGNDAIERSSDGGATWQTVFGPIKWEYLSDGFGGDGCIVYAQTMDTTDKYPSGLLRSTDQGQTWLPIGGPVNRDDFPLCGVTSRGAVCYAMSFRRGEPLWKYIDSSLLHPILSDLEITKTFPDTLYLNECDSVSVNMQLGFHACDFIRLQYLRIDSLSSNSYRSFFPSGNIIREGHPESSGVTFTPRSAGTYSFRIHIGVSAMDWSGADTSFPMVLVVSPNPAILGIDKRDTINFGTQVFCNAGGRDTIELSNLSCHSLKIKNIRLEMDSVAKYDFSAIMPVNYILKEGIGNGRVIVKFQPQSPGQKTGRLVIETSIGNDTIPIYANVLPSPKTLAIECEQMQSPVCDSVDAFVHFYNRSCREMTIDSLTLPNPFKLLPIRFPVILFAGDSAKLPFRFTPATRGISQVWTKAHLTFAMPFTDEGFDTVMSLSGSGEHGASAYFLSEKQLEFDTLHVCESSQTKKITIYSVGCDTLSLRAISLSGDPGFSLSENGKREIPVGDSLILNVILDPQSKSDKTGVISITRNDNSIVLIPLHGTVLRGIRSLSHNIRGILDFGSVPTCITSDTSITLTNSSCDLVEVYGVRWQVAGATGLGFGVTNTFPFSIAPGKSETINIVTILDTTGSTVQNSATLEILTDADNSIPSIGLLRSYKQPHPVHLWLDAGKNSNASSGIWQLKLKGIPDELKDIATIDFALNYNTDLLGYLPNKSTPAGSDGNTFSISGYPFIMADADSAIALLEFEVYLTKDTSTMVTLQSAILNSSNTSFMGCMAVADVAGKDINFSYLNNCGDASIRRSLKGEAILFSISPNPTHEKAEIHIRSQFDQQTKIEILNALGAPIYSCTKKISSGENLFHIDTHNYSPGIYFLRIGGKSETFINVK